MASTVTRSQITKNDTDIQIDENNLNISLESDHLDPEQKAAHEADTLPMDGPQAPHPKTEATDNSRNIDICQKISQCTYIDRL